MKKKIMLFSAKALSTAVIVTTLNYSACFAQGGDAPFAKGSKTIGLSIGAGVDYGYGTYYGGNYSNHPAIAVSYDQGIIDNVGPGNIGIGGVIGFKTATYKYSYYYVNTGNLTYKDTYTNFIIGVRAVADMVASYGALAYLIVWAWNEHKVAYALARKDSPSNLVVLVDEMENHLHPKWQRSVLPALMDVKDELADDLQVQLMIATHSPLVTASVEPFFEEGKDKLFHLDLATNGEVKLEEKDFLIYGTFDSWLTSEIFDLSQPKSREAEKSITEAVALQEQANPDPEEVKRVSYDLQKYLAAEDRFWPQWLYFAEQHGVDL